jgi:hypothetical protein
MLGCYFLFLLDIFFHSPRQAALNAITEVYMNGHGVSVYATIRNAHEHPERTIRNSRIELDLATIRNMVKSRIVKFKNASKRGPIEEEWSDGP